MEVKMTVAGRSAGPPKKMKKPAKRSTSSSPEPKLKPPAARPLLGRSTQSTGCTDEEEALPRVAATGQPTSTAPERFLSTAEVLQAFGYTETEPEPEAEKLPTIACARPITSLASPHKGPSPLFQMRLSCDSLVNALLSPPSVCSPRNIGATVIKRSNRLPPRRWASEGYLGGR